jgi:TonB family protein
MRYKIYLRTLFFLSTILVFLISCSSSKSEDKISILTCNLSTTKFIGPDTKIELLCFLTWDTIKYLNPPTIIGGIDSLISVITYPEIAVRAGVSGPVLCEFIITTEGNASDMKIIKGIGAGCDEAVLGAIGSIRYIPAKNNGVNINQLMRVSINFKLLKRL